jgi:3-oxoacyl-[acyl-carrier protein] reductase
MGGLHAMANAFAADCARHGVRVNCLLLGAAVGAMAALKEAYMTEEESKELWGTVTPLWRKAEAREVANAALFLASDMASYITGEALFVNGGQHIVAHNEIYRAGGWWLK